MIRYSLKWCVILSNQLNLLRRWYVLIVPKVTGFTDVAPVVREQTVKAVLTVVTKLSDRTINGELLRYLAKTANDEQPGIRTNTTICLGKIARNLGSNVRFFTIY